MQGFPRGSRWLAAGYLGLGGFLVLEATTRHRGEASSLEQSDDDDGTTGLIIGAYGTALLLPFAGARLQHFRLPRWVSGTGLGIELAGLGLRWLSMSTLRGSYSRTLRRAEDDQLVDAGPYAVVRHPGYLGSIMTWVGFSLTSGSIPTVAAVSALLGLAYRRRIRVEERLLLRELPGYASYVERTSRLLPRIW